MQIREGATPVVHDGSRTGVLVCHDFTGSPASVRPLADHLVSQGFSVRAPRLPGHGTNWKDLERTTWTDWYAEVESTYAELAERCDTVVAVGLSMGATLAALLVQRNASIAGLAVINPALATKTLRYRLVPMARRVLPTVRGIGNDIKKAGVTHGAYERVPLRAVHSQLQMWHQVTRDLPQVTQPVLLLRSSVDHIVSTQSSDLLRSRISSTDFAEVTLSNSYHVATLDHDASLIHDEITSFTNRLAGRA